MTFDLFAGVAHKEEGIQRAADAHREVLAAVRSHLVQLARTGATVTADDARWWLESHPAVGEKFLRERKDWMGALFRTGEWRAVGWVVSKAPENHARPIRVWRLKCFEEGV